MVECESPIAPELALAITPDRELGERLVALAEEGKGREAHRVAAGCGDERERRAAAATFLLLERSGRPGARKLLRWLRADEQAAAAGKAAGLFRAAARPALTAWAHFRLLRHGRALHLAEAALNRPAGGGADEATAWRDVLCAIRRLALRQGYLRHALSAHGLGRRFDDEAGDEDAIAREMAAVEFLLTRLGDHALPATVTRYLARSLGHRGEHSARAFAEMCRDLTLGPGDLDRALAVAGQLGLEERFRPPLEEAREKLFAGNWRARRVALRAGRLLFVVFATGFLLLVLVVLLQLLRG